jgi:hypothetical protein
VLRGRRGERETLDRLLDAVRAGQSRVLVVRGEAGVGKTALLDHLQAGASGCRVERAAGVESEMELPFAGLHQLCVPLLDGLDDLPVPQRTALGTAFGLSGGTAPDRFLVGLAVLGLLSEAAEKRPLVCLVDDAQWLDQVSAQVLAFVARRLLAEPIALVFAVRESRQPRHEEGEQEHATELAGLTELQVGGLSDADARPAELGAPRSAGRAGAGPDRGRDARQPPGPAGAAPGAQRRRAGRRVRPARRPAADQPHRAELPPAAQVVAGRDATPAAAGGGRAGR